MLGARALSRLSALPKHQSIIQTTIPASARAYAVNRAPNLADIVPESPESFNEAQAEFRARLKTEAEEKKRREQEESTSASARSDTSTSSSSSSDSSSSSLLGSTLSSLTSKFAEDARLREDAVSGKKAGPLTTLIYGTPEGREMDREIERSFSQVLARGKYVHSIVTHKVKPDKVDEYVELVGGWYPKVAAIPEMKVNLVGSWRTEIGDSDTFGEISVPCCHLDISDVISLRSAHLGVSPL
jgi:hypothetical protein